MRTRSKSWKHGSGITDAVGVSRFRVRSYTHTYVHTLALVRAHFHNGIGTYYLTYHHPCSLRSVTIFCLDSAFRFSSASPLFIFNALAAFRVYLYFLFSIHPVVYHFRFIIATSHFVSTVYLFHLARFPLVPLTKQR